MKQPEIELAQHVIQACKAKQIKHIIISPGSRNAPLTIGFSNDPYFSCYSIVDERCAAFFAMGMAQQLKHPAVVVCTSGSALLNYYPAIAEAFYSDIPLVVISADRPSNKIDIGDGQTIRQENVFANHSAYNANLSDKENRKSSNIYELNQALNTTIEQQAPVHINVPFEEPLYRTTEKVASFENIASKPIIPIINETEFRHFTEKWLQAKKKLVLVGVLHPESIENQYILTLAKDPSVLVLTETTSNLHHQNFVPHIDKLLSATEKNPELKDELQPEILLTFGGLVVSKKIKQFLRSFQPKYHYHIDLQKGYDSYFCLTHHFKSDVNAFFERFSSLWKPTSSNYRDFWLNINQSINKKHSDFVKQTSYSDFEVYHHIFSNIPENYMVHLSNSSTVRYAQLFPLHPSLKVFCNRGTSGIDGSTSTAIGSAVATQKPTLLITGDLSFFYNSNALWNAYTPNNFRIILINNQGGGIFRILPGNKSDTNFETYFETPHQLTAEHLCKMYRWNYKQTTHITDLKAELPHFFQESEYPKLLEIHTPRLINDKVLLDYFQFLKN